MQNSNDSNLPVAECVPNDRYPMDAGKIRGIRLPLAKTTRVIALLAGLCVLTLLIISRFLVPNADGMGTHQQLGLPPCTSIAMFGVRCPGCGMTTSWAWVMRGEIWTALQANVGGTMLALIAMAYIPWSCYFFLRGQSSRGEWFSLAMAILLVSAMIAATIQWMVRGYFVGQ